MGRLVTAVMLAGVAGAAALAYGWPAGALVLLGAAVTMVGTAVAAQDEAAREVGPRQPPA